MKIITWNSNGAFRKKYKFLEQFRADILVIQECEDPRVSNDEEYVSFAENYIWIGDNKNRGLGIFARGHFKIEQLRWSNIYRGDPVKYFLPFLINNRQVVLAIWAHRNNSPTFEYIGQVWKYIQVNADLIPNSILIGDFNSNKIWDYWDRWWNHSDVVKILERNGIVSLYHKLTKEKQGEESIKTFFLHRNINKGYHIDYCFLPEKLITANTKLEIPKFDDFKAISDHLPLIVEL